MPKHDLLVTGDCTAAYVAAIEAARLGWDVGLVVSAGASRLGPPILPRIRQALACRQLDHAPGGGQSRRASAWSLLAGGVERALTTYVEALEGERAEAGVRLLRGPARVRGTLEVEVGGETHCGGAVVIGVGVRPRRPAFFPFDDRVVCDRESIFQSGVLPRSLAVVGANEPGCELACLFAAFGVAVVLVDRRARLMRSVDRDLLALLHARMQQAGVEVVLEEEIEAIRVDGHPREPHAELRLGSGRVERFERLVVCAGSIPDLECPGSEQLSLDRDAQGLIITDEYGRTSQPGVYAVGDVAGVPSNLGTQIHRARVAALHALHLEPTLEEHPPTVIHTIPEIASVGLSEEACGRLGLPHVVGISAYPPRLFWESGAWEEGLLKLVVEAEQGRLVGVHVIGRNAGDALQLGAEFLRQGASAERLAGAILNAPGASEAYRLAACRALEKTAGHRKPARLRLEPSPA